MKNNTKNKMIIRSSYKLILALIAFCTISISSFAQAGFGTETDVVDTPISDHIPLVMLVVAGIGFGIYMLYKNKQVNKLKAAICS